MKFLYPIKKLNLKPWIKYWLLKKTSGESTLKAITISTGTLKKVDISKSLSIKEYYGNTVQNGNPSPQAPVPVQVVKEDNTITINEDSYRVDLGGKNKLDLSAFTTTTSNGITVTPITNNGVLEYLESSGTYSQITYIAITNNLVIEPNTTYTLSGGYPSARIRLREYNNNTNLSEYWDNGAGVTFTSRSNVTRVNVQIVFYAQNNLKFYPQIELGTVATPYSPYVSNPIELCKIGNYQDKLYYDNGTWKVEKNIDKVEIKQNGYIGVQDIISSVNKFIWRYASALNVAGSGNRDTLLCNYFVGDTSIWGNNNKIGVYINGSNQTNFAMLCSTVGGTTSNTKGELLSMLETWLTTNNVIMYYPLATPTYTEITNSNLISQLNALYEFYVQSSTVSISNDSEIPFEVLLEYYGR